MKQTYLLKKLILTYLQYIYDVSKTSVSTQKLSKLKSSNMLLNCIITNND